VAILKATHELRWDVGFDKLSIVEVATRAGVGKATIYRWWPDKGALVMEAFLTRVAPTIAFPHTASALNDIRVKPTDSDVPTEAMRVGSFVPSSRPESLMRRQ
jgi:AcrR family transcriptional regulator